jgi:hypothetical protein
MGRGRRFDDAGGVWIVTGIVLGVLLYGFIVLMDVAGFTPVAPLVIIPPVLVALIGANSLLGGGRTRSTPQPVPRRAPASSNGASSNGAPSKPMSSNGANSQRADGTLPLSAPNAEEPGEAP